MKKHELHEYLKAPTHPITILVVGCGGTGSYVVTQLAKMQVALAELRGIQIEVMVMDDDIVESHNVGRQMFSPSDIGHYKAEVIVSRINRFYGLEWQHSLKRFDGELKDNIIISCVDNVATRMMIKSEMDISSTSRNLHEWSEALYWMDFGNSKDTGQYVLSNNINLKDTIELFGEMEDKPDEPSCSMAESLNQQDLFINLQLATSGVNLLYKLLKTGSISYQGQFLNTETGFTRPILIK